jgi:acetylornithine deacetylase/succinyl-diaminopimelate desuccinylase-like protein
MALAAEPTARPVPLSDEQRKWYERVVAEISTDRLRDLIVEMTGIPSPTGGEGMLAAALVRRGRQLGLEAELQMLDEQQGNAVLRYGGEGSGPDLLLYAPIDTHTTGDEADDLPWVGDELRADMRPQALALDRFVIGLGANNPKGHAACVIAAVEAAYRAGVPLLGSVTAGLGSGGMPTNQWRREPGARQDVGHGRGVAFMLERGYRPDYAVIAKTGWAVSWEEVGLAWIKVRISGEFNYTGIRHFTRYVNPIVRAADVITRLEAWTSRYTSRNTSGLVAPQASIGAIEGGWTYKPTYIPAACDLYLDVRLSPRTSVGELRQQFGEVISEIAADNPESKIEWRLLVTVPGTHTDPDSWIVQSVMRGWQEIEGRAHESRRNQSGATDANVLRGMGVPTARIGMPRVGDDAPVPDDFSKGMNVVDVADMATLTRCLAYTLVDTCLRSRTETGLAGA